MVTPRRASIWILNAAAAILPGGLLAEPASGDGPAPGEASGTVASRVARNESGHESSHLTGSWGGVRDRWVARGVHWSAGYVGEVAHVASGGQSQGTVYNGLFELGLELDPERMGAWEGGLFHLSALNLHGESPTGKHAGDLLGLSNIDAFDTTRLYELWLEQSLAADRASLRVGWMGADEEFAGTGGGAGLINSAFGWPAFISANVPNTGPAFSVPGLGIRARVQFTESLSLQSGVYDGDTFDSPAGDPHPSRHGGRADLSSSQGVFWITEAACERGESATLPGALRLGFWLHTADVDDNLEDDGGGAWIATGSPARSHSHNLGIYAAADQWIWREDGSEDQGLAAFARAGASPGDRSFFNLVVDAGVAYSGLLPSRDEDQLTLGFVHARISGDIRRRERLGQVVLGAPSDAFSSHESVLELSYRAVLRPWWTVQPDLQWIMRPGGNSSAPDAWVALLRTEFVF